MDRQIDVLIRGSHLSKDCNLAGVQHEANAAVLRIGFDEGWDGLAKKVTFWDAKGQNPVERILTADMLEDMILSTRTYLCPIPGEAMTEAGMMTFVVDGWKEGKRCRSVSDSLIVRYAPFIEQAEQPVDPTPTQAEQLQQQIDNLLGDMRDQAVRAENAAEDAETARAGIEEARNAAEAAKGSAEAAQGKAENAVAHVPYINADTKTWMVWDVEVGVYKDSGVCAKGEDGYTPVKGKDYFDGAPGAGVKVEYDEETRNVRLVNISNGEGGGGGTDGGYYTPSVQEDGTLSWTASKEDMPEIETSNIRGPQGEKPVKGTDYFTEAEKTEMVNSVLAALPTWTGGSY